MAEREKTLKKFTIGDDADGCDYDDDNYINDDDDDDEVLGSHLRSSFMRFVRLRKADR